MVKKFFKTYYSLPDKHNRIDVVFERGFKNIQVLYNKKEIATFLTAGMLLAIKEIITPDDSVIHLRFLKDTADFEIFHDGIQIDNSETSPKKVIEHLKWPIYISMSWYILVLLFSFFETPILFELIIRNPLAIITNIAVVYLITSTVLVLIFMIVSLIWLNKGNSALYFTAMIVVAGDLAFGTIYQLTSIFSSGIQFELVLIFALILPLLFKSAAVGSFYRNWNKFKAYSKLQTLQKTKINPELVDLE